VSRIATFLACDEIANVGLNKLAYVGLYVGEMIVPSFPFVLNQLFFVVTFRTPIDDLPKEFRVRIERPGVDAFFADNTASLNMPGQAPTPESRFYQIQAIVRIAPFEITEAGVVRIFVEDEHGDNYAGGLRLKVGVLPEMKAPQIISGATLVAAHFLRLQNQAAGVRERIAYQLLSAFSSFLNHLGVTPTLPAPKDDIRILLDQKRIRVFFPEPISPPQSVSVLRGGNFEQAIVEEIDDLGFTVQFEPSAPIDLGFAFKVQPNTEPEPRKRKARAKSPR
jgi:hypothetical protein